jgi:hypothetical protein
LALFLSSAPMLTFFWWCCVGLHQAIEIRLIGHDCLPRLIFLVMMMPATHAGTLCRATLPALTGHWQCHPMLRCSFPKADIHAPRSISSPSMSQKRTKLPLGVPILRAAFGGLRTFAASITKV